MAVDGLRLAEPEVRVGIDFRVVTAAPNSGAAKQTLALYDALRQREQTQVLALTAAPFGHPHRERAVCPAYSTPLHAIQASIEQRRFERDFLPQAIRVHELDVYVATANRGLPRGLSSAQRQGTRWVLQIHELLAAQPPWSRGEAGPTWWQQLRQRREMAHSLALADEVWVPSAYTAHGVQSRWPMHAGKLRLLPHAVPVQAWQLLHRDVYAPARYWLAVGLRERRKNIQRLIGAWRRARAAAPLPIPDLVVVGHPKDLGQDAADVRFVHGIQDDQLSSWYRQAEWLWHPAWAEDFGLPVLEAAACGTPAATAQGSALDEVTPRGSPRFDPNDELAMAELMLKLARQGRLHAPPAADLLAWAQGFDLAHHARRVDELLRPQASPTTSHFGDDDLA